MKKNAANSQTGGLFPAKIGTASSRRRQTARRRSLADVERRERGVATPVRPRPA